MSDDPATLRLYAEIFEKPRRDHRGGPIRSPSEFCLAAAVALRERADRLEIAHAFGNHKGESK